ncbi:GON-4-like protein, partial [Bulinus truncatus]
MCMATDLQQGMIEVVTSADTMANIQRWYKKTAFDKKALYEWLKINHQNEGSLNAAVDEFTLSCAGYCVATYILGIGDRHNDNIMMKTSGQLTCPKDNYLRETLVPDMTEADARAHFRVEQKKITVFKTPKKGVHKKSPPKSQKRTPKKNLLKIKASFTTPKKRRLSEDTASEDIKSKRLKNQDDNTEDNDEEGWQDVHDGDESEKLNVDVALEQKAIKVKMNAKNVKSVIHHVLTNEHVLNMFKSVLESENGDSPEKKDETPNNCFTADKLDCVPKLTRAKVKDLLEKVCVPSPVKPGREGPSILDVEFAEEEDDDEYNPEKDDECHESDDDESIVSSQLSEFGSPYPTTPSTPIIRHNAEEALTTTPVHSIQTMNLNLGTPRNLVTDFNQTFDAMAEEDKDGVDTIALRTRSKLPLTSTSITDIENAFVAPDITPDMYDNTYEDADWVQFLSSLCKPSDETITDDDADANDPEFNYIAEAEREKPDEEDFRFDKPTQITKKELTSLINELNDMFEDELLPYQVVASVPDMNVQFPQQIKPINDCQIQGSSSSASALFNDFKTPQPQNNINTAPVGTYQNEFGNENIESFFTSEQLAQTQDNLRKHIQLLIQSSLLFQDREIQTETTTPQNMLLELETMRNESPLGLNSVYNVCNLDPALELLKDNSLLSTEKTSPDKVSVVQWKPGLEQFQYCRNVNPVELIHRYLIRGKNANQIHFRIQFMSSPKVGDNPIKSVKKTGKLPEDFPKPVVDEYFPMAPKDQVSDLLPKWCLLTATKPSGSLIVKADNSKSKQKSITPRLAPDARLLSKNKIQALPTLILPNAMAPVSGIYIQFGQPSNLNTPNLPSPFAVNNQNYFTVSNLDSSLCSSPFSVKSTHSSSSQTEENYKLSKNKTEENTLTEETSAHNMSLSSPDVLAKTMISCGIQESPLSSSSSMSEEPVSSSALCHQASSKHPIVRNLSSAFDAAHSVCEKSHKSSRSHHNPKSSKAKVVVDQIKYQEINESVNEMGRATTLKADTGNLCVLSDSVSDHEMNLVIEESGILSSQENTITAHSGKITSSELVKPIRKTVSQNLSTTTQDSLLNIPDVNTNPRDINKSDFLSLMDSCSEVNSKEKSVKSSDFQADRNGACLNSEISNLNKTLLKDTEAKTPTKLRLLVPKPATPSSTYTPLPKLSPRRKELNKQVRQIIPKTFVFEAKSPSPTKAAALMLKKKATLVCQQRSPVKILPKSPQPVESSSCRSRVILTPSRMYTRSQHLKTKNTASDALIQKRNQEEARQDKIKSREIIQNEMNGLEEPNLSQEEEEEEEAFVEDDQIQLEDLMAASTTIKYDPKKGSCADSDTKTKSQRKKDIRLAMLDPDIIECDPKKDERDTAYAQFYFSRVKEVLKDDLERFRKFLTLLHDQNKDHCNPIE